MCVSCCYMDVRTHRFFIQQRDAETQFSLFQHHIFFLSLSVGVTGVKLQLQAQVGRTSSTLDCCCATTTINLLLPRLLLTRLPVRTPQSDLPSSLCVRHPVIASNTHTCFAACLQQLFLLPAQSPAMLEADGCWRASWPRGALDGP